MFNVIWDSGASICVTNNKSDFIQYEPCALQSVKGIGGNHCKIAGKGTVCWKVHDEVGKP